MSTAVAQGYLSDSNSPRVKRKPAPVAQIQIQPSHSSNQLQERPQQLTQSRHKSSFSERYPDPDPTDPFAPLWVLRNRTTSVLRSDASSSIGPLLQREPSSQQEFGVVRQADRRLSVSYLHTFTVAPTSDGESDAPQSGYTSDLGYGTSLRPQRTYSTDDGGSSSLLALKRQSMKPIRLSQVAPLLPTISRSPITPISPRPIPTVTPQQSENDYSGTESDETRVGHPGPDKDATPPIAAQQPKQRPRVGSTNKLARFLKTRKASQTDTDSHDARASIADADRIRKASISPPVYSTVVWTGHGQDSAVPIQNHPLHQDAIPIIAPASPIHEIAPSSPTQLTMIHPKQYFLAVEASVPIQHSPSPSPSLQPATISDSIQSPINTPLPPPEPPVLATRPSQTSRTDETHSSFSFVHVPSAMSSPSLAQLAPESLMTQGLGRPATAPLLLGPGIGATITSPATTKIKRSKSRPTSKLPPPRAGSMAKSPLASSPSTATLPFTSQLHPAEEISEWDLPTLSALSKAASLPVIAESGVRVNFGTLFAQQKTVVVFIRHFWCPLCQDYMTSVASLTRRIPDTNSATSSQDAVNEKVDDDGESSGGAVRLVVISNGSYTMIGKYKQIFGAVGLDIYTDPSLAVYAALGMGKDPASLPDHGHDRPKNGQAHLSAEVLSSSGDEKVRSRRNTSNGGYVKHGLMGGIAMVFVRALKVGMPVWEKGGDLNQLGGEFVFGPGLVCTYAHRMRTTRGHAPFEDVLRAANITLLPSRPLPTSKTKSELEKKQPNALRKARRSSESTNSTTNVSSRNPSIDVLSTSSSAPLQTNTSKPQSQPSAVPERKKSHRRRRSVRTSTVNTNGVTHPDSGEKGARAPTSPPTSPISAISPSLSDPAFTVTTPTSDNDMTDPEMKWMDERHRSLQKIKERKNARRGLSQVDERQATLSMSISQSRSHSRPPSLSPPVSPSQSTSHTPSPRQARHRQRSSTGMEKTGRRSRHTSSSGAPRGFIVNESELGVQSDTGIRPRRETIKGGRSRSVSRREDDDVVLLGREARVSRIPTVGWDHTRRERSSSVGVKPHVGDDLETVSDKTLVHQ